MLASVSIASVITVCLKYILTRTETQRDRPFFACELLDETFQRGPLRGVKIWRVSLNMEHQQSLGTQRCEV